MRTSGCRTGRGFFLYFQQAKRNNERKCDKEQGLQRGKRQICNFLKVERPMGPDCIKYNLERREGYHQDETSDLE